MSRIVVLGMINNGSLESKILDHIKDIESLSVIFIDSVQPEPLLLTSCHLDNIDLIDKYVDKLFDNKHQRYNKQHQFKYNRL